MIFDIDASTRNTEPNFSLLAKLASVSRMPLCYGGGVRSLDHFDRIISAGVEKVSLSSSAIDNPILVSEASSLFGSQSVVVTLDIKKRFRFSSNYSIYTHNASRRSPIDLIQFCSGLRQLGAGELMISSINLDGTLKGFDFELLDLIYPLVDIPITVVGGASSYKNISTLFNNYPFVSAGVGSLFTFHGKFNAVLISYPSFSDKARIFENFTSA